MLKQESLPASTTPPRQRASRARIRVQSWTWLVVCMLLLALQLFFPARAWTTLLIMLGVTWLLALLWTLLLARRLFIRREMRYGWAQVGDTLQERYTLYNDGRLPAAWLEVQDHSNIPGYHTGHVTSVRGSEILGWRTEGICTRRGLFTLGPTSLRSGDPFGLFSAEIH